MAKGIGQRTLIFDQGDSLLRKRITWNASSTSNIQIGGVMLTPGSSFDFTISELISAGLTSSHFGVVANTLLYVGNALHPTIGNSIGDYDDGTGSGAVAAATTTSQSSGSGK